MQGQTPCCVGVEIEQIIFDHELGQRVVHARRRRRRYPWHNGGECLLAGAVQFKFSKKIAQI